MLKPGGKAQHCTLGTVSIIEIGPMGATIEFFSERAKAVKERKVLLADLEPLPDETDFRDDAGTPADVDNDDPLQARSPARRTRAAEPCAVHDAIPALFHAPKLHSAAARGEAAVLEPGGARLPHRLFLSFFVLGATPGGALSS